MQDEQDSHYRWWYFGAGGGAPCQLNSINQHKSRCSKLPIDSAARFKPNSATDFCSSAVLTLSFPKNRRRWHWRSVSGSSRSCCKPTKHIAAVSLCETDACVPVPEGFQLLAPSRIWPFLTSDIFSLAGKARMAADLLLPRGNTNGASDESLASFVRRRLGEEALARMAQPMVGGIYTADPETLSLRATLPRFLEMEREHRSLILAMLRQGRTTNREEQRGTSGARYSLFLSFDHGMQVLVDAVTKSLGPTDVRLNTRAEAIKRDGPTWTVTTHTGEPIVADALCLALPAYVAAALVQELDLELTSSLKRVQYASTATINFAYRRCAIKHPLDGFGFVVPYIEKRSLLACTFSSVKFSGRAPDDHVLLRVFAGGALQPEIFALEEAELRVGSKVICASC